MSRIRRNIGIGGALGALALLAVSATGKDEGLRLETYRDVVGVPTACYGETRDIRMGMKFTKPQCDAMFIARLDEFGDAIEKCVPSAKDMPAARYVAHLRLAYNIGKGGYCGSSIARRQNAGDVSGACDAFLMWNKAGGRVIAGLDRRRKDERAMCRKGL